MVEPLIHPRHITLVEETDNRTQFTIEPLYPGYGTTLGNSLRRILLSSLPGCAISAMAIPGVHHEFSTLKDIKEDVVDILLNLKQVRFRMEGEHEEPVPITLEFNGSGEILAKEFKTFAGIEVVTPLVHIATATSPDTEFNLVVYLTRGRGFLPVESREKEKLDIGTIAIDAIYSPVRHVALNLEHVRVGQMTNFDKIVLTVETDGSISPKDALIQSLDIFRDQISSLVFEDAQEHMKSSVEEPTHESGESQPQEKSDGGNNVQEEAALDAPKKKTKRSKKNAA
ncbi:MAG: DNA-directed RNA polymerase subunit alpha [Patescibacteria group bacterium]